MPSQMDRLSLMQKLFGLPIQDTLCQSSSICTTMADIRREGRTTGRIQYITQPSAQRYSYGTWFVSVHVCKKNKHWFSIWKSSPPTPGSNYWVKECRIIQTSWPSLSVSSKVAGSACRVVYTKWQRASSN